MAEPTKSLHVSYGSFSCTLEGFADPVAVMIAVTEHFRELAARDPAFVAAGMPGPDDVARLAQCAKAGLPDGVVWTVSGLGKPWLRPVAVSPNEEAAVVAQEVAVEHDGAGPLSDEGLGRRAEAEAALRADASATAAPEADAAGRPPDRQKTLTTLPGADDAALSRLLTESDMRLADPEAMRRRSTLASLKAAVVATEAARASGETPEAELEARRDRFRRDVHQAADETPEQAAVRLRSAPLRLVASQRVDLAPEGPRVAKESRVDQAPAQTAPAQPIPAQPASQPASQTSADFASFAAEMGATSLPELIEAAAAWRALVWSTEDVSRPDLLKLASEALPGEPSREEGLGAFGSLLSEGKLARVGSGRFRVTDRSRFDPGKLAG